MSTDSKLLGTEPGHRASHPHPLSTAGVSPGMLDESAVYDVMEGDSVCAKL